MNDKKIRFGMIGCGDVSRVYLGSIRRTSNAQLVATSDIVGARAESLMKESGAEAYYLDSREMLKNPRVDAVIILTDIGSHSRLAVEAAEAGKHMIIQKSMATNLKDADEVVRAVRKAGVKAIVEPSSHLSPWNQKAKQLIDNGAIGKVCYIHGIGSSWGPGTRWYHMADHGGGPMFNMGSYPVAHITSIIGPAKRVTGMAAFSIPERQMSDGSRIRITAEDNTLTLIDFGRGALCCIESNYVTRFLPSDMFLEGYCRFHGSEGSLVVSRDLGVQLISTEKEYSSYDSPGWFKPAVQLRAFDNWIATFWYYDASVAHLADCIMSNKEPLPSVEWGRHVTEILSASLESARSGKSIDLSSTF